MKGFSAPLPTPRHPGKDDRRASPKARRKTDPDRR